MTDADLEARIRALEEKLHDHGLLPIEEVSSGEARVESAGGNLPSPALGARVVARAWVDAEFRSRLLSDAPSALEDYLPQGIPVAVLEDTPAVHHVIVCTLCSCYPSGLLGNPPTWYKSFEYRSRVVREPRAVLAEFGTVVPEGIEIRVHDSTAEQRYLVLPLRPAGTDGWDEERLAGLVSRNSLIGTGFPLPPG
ncbi:MAG TPA: nitrile hydratase subunit alpha [Acidimicrobiales bacterium]|nr:nitrile hydratase subunit alpha [Acidimicrobiales bacterium]